MQLAFANVFSSGHLDLADDVQMWSQNTAVDHDMYVRGLRLKDPPDPNVLLSKEMPHRLSMPTRPTQHQPAGHTAVWLY